MVREAACYDLMELARSNMHVHTTFSRCAKPGMEIEAIIAEARRCGLRRMAITNHYNSTDEPILEQNRELRQRAEGLIGNMIIYYGSELSAYGIGKYLDTPEINAQLEFRLYAYNHFHLDFWEQPEDPSPRGYVLHSLAVLEHLFRSDRADSVAHPFSGRHIRCLADPTLVTRAITDTELGDIMRLGHEHGCAWELHTGTIMGDPEFGKRYWHIGREIGVSFNMATDAHRVEFVDPGQYLPSLRDILG